MSSTPSPTEDPDVDSTALERSAEAIKEGHEAAGKALADPAPDPVPPAVDDDGSTPDDPDSLTT